MKITDEAITSRDSAYNDLCEGLNEILQDICTGNCLAESILKEGIGADSKLNLLDLTTWIKREMLVLDNMLIRSLRGQETENSFKENNKVRFGLPESFQENK